VPGRLSDVTRKEKENMDAVHSASTTGGFSRNGDGEGGMGRPEKEKWFNYAHGWGAVWVTVESRWVRVER
jgi:hypothetical protein